MPNHFGMKKIFLLLFVIPSLLLAQNVGIGTATPTGKLEIHHRSSLVPGLKLVDSATNFGGVIEFRNMNFARGMKVSGFSSNNFNNGQYLDIRSDSITVMTVKGNGFVGIRDLEPSYPLDVQGDINVTGLLRVNGNTGTEGQVLQSNGNGTMNWADMCEYKNYMIFNFTTSGATQTFTVPSGITKIKIKAWGGGGAGAGIGGLVNMSAGGGGGGYVEGYMTVVPLSIVNIVVGRGVSSSFVSSSSSSVSQGAILFSALGGGNAFYNEPSNNVTPGRGGGVNVAGTNNYFAIEGEDGGSSKLRYYQTSATSYGFFYEMSDGGNAGNTENTKGKGGNLFFNLTLASITSEVIRTDGHVPGGGASNFAGLVGGNGGNGKVIIYY
jgi:hypothetical protein